MATNTKDGPQAVGGTKPRRWSRVESYEHLLPLYPRTVDECLMALESAAARYREYKAAGVAIDRDGSDEWWHLLTTSDPEVADRFEFTEDELVEDEDEDEEE